MSKEALKLALEALQTAHLAVEDDMLADEIQQAITAIREALAEQPAQQQEPVAWQWKSTMNFLKKLPETAEPGIWRPVYTFPPESKPLTDEQILAVARDHYNPHQRPEISFARAIEAAHGIKENT